jgi:CBS-domain-containing membrane protein
MNRRDMLLAASTLAAAQLMPRSVISQQVRQQVRKATPLAPCQPHGLRALGAFRDASRGVGIHQWRHWR